MESVWRPKTHSLQNSSKQSDQGFSTIGPMNTSQNTTTARPIDHDWEEAGEAWGHRATDWACLYEHYASEVIAAMFDRIGITDGTSHLDIACGAGLAVRQARGMGASVAGLDASAPLLAIARDRNPESDIRHGSMFELPWADRTFDSAVSVNGIWGGCEAALAEAHRVLKPGAPMAISFWGKGRPLDLRDAFIQFAVHSPESHIDGMRRTNDIAQPGVAEAMLEGAGFVVTERGRRLSTIEWPDPDTAWRAMSSAGPAVPALLHAGEATLKSAVLEAIDHCRDERGIYRFCNVHDFVVAQRH